MDIKINPRQLKLSEGVKAMLLKDMLYFRRKFFFILLLIMFCLVMIPYFSYFTNIYAAALVSIPFAYDRYYKWDRTASFLPVHPRAVVLARYIISFLFLILLLIALVPMTLIAQDMYGYDAAPDVKNMLFNGIISILQVSVMIPLYYRFNEKLLNVGLVYGIISFFPAVLQLYLMYDTVFGLYEFSSYYFASALLLIGAILVIPVLIVSYILANRFYRTGKR